MQEASDAILSLDKGSGEEKKYDEDEEDDAITEETPNNVPNVSL